MRTIGISIVLALVAAVVAMAGRPAAAPATPSTSLQAPRAQMDAAMMKVFASSADVQALLAKAKAERIVNGIGIQ